MTAFMTTVLAVLVAFFTQFTALARVASLTENVINVPSRIAQGTSNS